MKRLVEEFLRMENFEGWIKEFDKWTIELVDELENKYVTQEELDDSFTDYGLDIHSVEDFVGLVDDMEDRIADLQAQIDELKLEHE
jgi:hypothetical protein